MNTEPRTQGDYGERGTEAAHRVLVDLGQVLGSFFENGLVVVGGWVPELLVKHKAEPHSRSIDIDLALYPGRLLGGRYAEMVRALLHTGRYEQTEKPFQLRARVDLEDGGPGVSVNIDFLKPKGRWPAAGGAEPMPEFRPLDTEACTAAFVAPESVTVEGFNIAGARNSVVVAVTSLEGFLIMKAFALDKREKPKDAYDICYCLDNEPGWAEGLARSWHRSGGGRLVAESIRILRVKFASVDSFGPRQVAAFRDAPTEEGKAMDARRAFELVARFLRRVDGAAG